MKPQSYIKKDNKIIFKYPEKDLKEFHKIGKSEGGAGHYLHSIEDDKYFNYKSYGTIEAPVREEMTITMITNPMYDGEFDLEKFMNPPERKLNHEDFKFDILDFGKQS